MVERGDFYALMFFMVAIGNLVAYGILGWLTNIYAQVSLKNPDESLVYLQKEMLQELGITCANTARVLYVITSARSSTRH